MKGNGNREPEPFEYRSSFLSLFFPKSNNARRWFGGHCWRYGVFEKGSRKNGIRKIAAASASPDSRLSHRAKWFENRQCTKGRQRCLDDW